jgi:amino acid permease
MLPNLAIPMETSLVAYMELFIVLAFFIGWYILEKVANSYDRDESKPDTENAKQLNDERSQQDPF